MYSYAHFIFEETDLRKLSNLSKWTQPLSNKADFKPYTYRI